MKNLDMKECYKVIWTMKKKKPANINYKSEKIMLPCLCERDVEEFEMKAQFAILLSRKIISFDYIDNDKKEGYFILTERFWNLLYDAVLMRVVGGRLNEYDIEEELQDYGEEEENY